MFRRCAVVFTCCFFALAGCSKKPVEPTVKAVDSPIVMSAFVQGRVAQASDRVLCAFSQACSGVAASATASKNRPADAAAPARRTSVAPAAPKRGLNRANPGVFTIITSAADFPLAAELVNVLNGDGLRVLPVIGLGPVSDLEDIMYHGVDLGIVPVDTLASLGEQAPRTQEDISYIATLFSKELHVLAGREIADVRKLDGRKVNIGAPGTRTHITARRVFESLGIAPEFTTYDEESSRERLRAGEIQAAVYVSARPSRAILDFQSDGRFRLLSVPYDRSFADVYQPAQFDAKDYPNLLQPGERVETISVANVLATFNWPRRSERYKRLAHFVEEFYARFDDLRQPGTPEKWRQVNPFADAPGWQRFGPADDWLSRRARRQAQDVGGGRTAEALPAN